MDNNQKQLLKELEQTQTDLTHDFIDYWLKYSSFDTWQFWIHIALLVVPLIVLYFKIERKKAFLLGFFGFNVHVWFTYIDTFGAKLGYWSYPYQVMPVMTVSFGLDVSLIPIVYMFLYQWVMNRNKNYYVYFIGLCLFLSYVFKPILVWMNFFELNNGATYFHLFMGYIVIMLVSKWITNVFIYFEKGIK